MSDFPVRPALLAVLSLCFGGCQRQLAPADFLQRYEQECAMTVEREGYRFLLLYQSPEYLAVKSARPDAQPEEFAALTASYSQGYYVRISIRPAPAGSGEEKGNAAAAAVFGSDPLLPQVVLGERLKAVEPQLAKRIRLRANDGREIEAVSASLQRGLKTGAGNVILAVFPRENQGKPVDLDKCELEIDDLGLNLGTLRKKLSLPKGFRLKVAA